MEYWNRRSVPGCQSLDSGMLEEEEEEERSGLPAECWNRRRRSVPGCQSLDSGMLEEEEYSGLPVS